MMVALPKKIWILWFQGEEEMPYVVRHCFKSWKIHNPEYDIQLLTSQNYTDFIEIEEQILSNGIITKQALSDIVRVFLLDKYGGVWVDATCFCTKPLDAWLPQSMTFDFYAFQKPGVDRLISSWFLASEAKGDFISAYKQKVLNYWMNSNVKKQMGGDVDVSSLNDRTMQRLKKTKGMSWAFVLRFFIEVYIKKKSPYFWFHYLFALILHSNMKMKRAWFEQNSFSSDGPHILIREGLDELITDDIKQVIASNDVPLYKLDWRIDESDLRHDSILQYLFREKNI